MVEHQVSVGGKVAITAADVGLRVERGAESWQFFAFVFAAVVTLALTLIDELPIREEHWLLAVALKSGTFVLLAYLTLVNAWMRNWLVGVLGMFKRAESR